MYSYLYFAFMSSLPECVCCCLSKEGGWKKSFVFVFVFTSHIVSSNEAGVSDFQYLFSYLYLFLLDTSFVDV